MAVVAFAGSRSLPFDRHTVEEVSRVVAAVVAAGRTIAVGCSVGADAAVLSCRLALPFPESTSGSALRVFAVGGKEGEKMTGFWSGSAVSVVSDAAELARSPGHGCFAPVQMNWWAGGEHAVLLRRRLAARSSACVAAAAAGGKGSGFIAFTWVGPSVGTWRSARLAAAAGLPVIVFPCGGAEFKSLAPGGRWVQAGSGVWSWACRWVPAGVWSPEGYHWSG